MVRFRSGSGMWVVPLEHTLEVRMRDAMRTLPDPHPGVEGVVEHDDIAVPVVRALGFGGRHVLVLREGTRSVGLLVDEVIGVVEVVSSAAGPAPAGQRTALVAGTVREGDELAYVLDVGRLADDVVGAQEDRRR
jgi:chemotaxis signal transduction protein